MNTIVMNDGAGAPAGGAAPTSAPSINVPSSNVGQSQTPATPTNNAVNTTVQPTATPPESFDVKVNGKVVKMTRQELIDNASMSSAANEKFNEAAKMRKEYESFLKTVKESPLKALTDPRLGLTKEQVRAKMEEWYHKEFIIPEGMTEEQKRLAAAEERLKTYEEQEAAQKRQTEEQELAKLTATQTEYLQNQIIEAMEASGLPKTKFIVSRMAFYMRQNMQQGWEAPTSLIVQQVKREQQDLIGGQVKELDAPGLIALFGEDVINKIRAHDLKQLRERRANPPVQTAGGVAANPSGGTGKIPYSEVNKRLRDMRTGKFTG